MTNIISNFNNHYPLNFFGLDSSLLYLNVDHLGNRSQSLLSLMATIYLQTSIMLPSSIIISLFAALTTNIMTIILSWWPLSILPTLVTPNIYVMAHCRLPTQATSSHCWRQSSLTALVTIVIANHCDHYRICQPWWPLILPHCWRPWRLSAWPPRWSLPRSCPTSPPGRTVCPRW